MSGNETFDEDPRYRLSAKGAALFAVVYLVIGAVSMTLGFTLGRPGAEITYVLGFPSWVFWTLIVWQVVVVGIIFVLVRFTPYFRDIPLTESGEPEPEDEAA
ncbi:MAG: DUF997 family protein [Streptosporangiales bacterium]|nr:DUF997 family protein [Streptosporangiales bacterium]